MKFHELTIENYGIHASRQLDLGDGGLRMVYGPNEAGKSTMLQLVRELLFGFPHQSSFAFADHTGKMAAAVQATLADGRRLSFRRQKGRGNTVAGEFIPGGELIDERVLSGLLDGAGSELYDHVFGFSLQELSAGEQSLQHANLNEALYGGGIGGLAGFQKVREAVRTEHTALYSARGRKPRINSLLADIRKKKKQLTDCALRPTDYEERLNRLKAQQEREADRQQHLSALRTQLNRLTRMAESADLQAKLAVAREQLDELPRRDHFPVDGKEQLRQLSRQLADLQQQQAMLGQELQDLEDQHSALPCAPELLEHLAEVSRLIEDVGQMTEFEQSIPRLQQQVDSQQQQLLTGLADLNPDWSVDDVADRRPTLAQRSTMKSLYEEFQQLEKQQAAHEARRPDLQRQISAARKKLQALPALDRMPALADLINRSQDYLASESRRQDLQSRLADQQLKVQQLLERLSISGAADDSPGENSRTASGKPASPSSTDLGEISELLSRPVPRPETVTEFAERMSQASVDLNSLQKERAERQNERAEAERRLQTDCLDAGVATRDQLLDKRRQRDQTWQQLKARYVLKKNSDETPKPDELEHLTVEADRMADDRQQNAETVARQEHLSQSIERLTQQLEEVDRQIETQTAAGESLSEDWQALWGPSKITPESPAAMQKWLQLREQLVEEYGEQRRLETRLSELQAQAARFEEELRAAVPADDKSAAACLAVAREELEHLREARSQQQRLKAELPDDEARLSALDDEVARHKVAHESWQKQWRILLTDCRLPPTWTPVVAVDALQQLDDLHQTRQQIQQNLDQLHRQQTAFTTFTSDVNRIVQAVAGDLTDASPLAAIRELARRVKQAQEARKDEVSLQQQRRLLNRQVREIEQQLEQQQLKRQQLLAAAEAATEDQFYEVAEQMEQRRQLETRMEQLETSLKTALKADQESDLLDALQSTSVDQIEAQKTQVQEDIEIATREYREAVEAVTLLQNELEEFEQDGRYAELTAQVGSLQSELSTAVDQWAPLVLMEALMDRALKSFERNHQPKMVTSVSELFRRLTHNRYKAIRRRLDGGQQLSVVDQAGHEKQPGELSTGTREQLYLAIRLAFVLHYCETHEPLPIVMDDVLVNFDRQRARETLAVLNELSERVQILFLTCHDHMIDLGQEIGLSGEPICLTDVRPVTARSDFSPAARSAAETDTTPRRRRRKNRSEEDQPELFSQSDEQR